VAEGTIYLLLVNCHVRKIKCRMRWAEHVARMGEERCVQCLGGEIGGKDTTGGNRRRWVDNIRVDLQDVRCEYLGWIGLALDRDGWWRLVSAVMNIRVP